MVKAKNIIIGKEIEVQIVDPNYNNTSVEVKILEGVFSGRYTIVNKRDLVKTKKSKANLSIGKFEGEDDRALGVHILAENESLLDSIIDFIESKADDYGLEIDFCRCPYDDEDMIGDSFYVDFEYGMMTDTKKSIKLIWKEAKAVFNIR